MIKYIIIALYSHDMEVWYYKDTCRFTHVGPFFKWVDAIGHINETYKKEVIIIV